MISPIEYPRRPFGAMATDTVIGSGAVPRIVIFNSVVIAPFVIFIFPIASAWRIDISIGVVVSNVPWSYLPIMRIFLIFVTPDSSAVIRRSSTFNRVKSSYAI